MSKRGLVSALSLVSTLLAGSVAWAQEETTGEVTGEVGATTSTDVAPPSDDTGGAFGFKAGTLGVGVVFQSGGQLPVANALYFLDPNTALNLALGISLSSVEAPPPEDRTTVFGILLGAGYRMYKPLSGRVRPFLEPGGAFSIANFDEAGETMALNLYAVMGVEFVVVDQFTLGTGVGATLTFANEFKNISFGLITNPIIATIYW